MRITVYTQGYNAQAYLRPCVESVLAQTMPDFEFVLIDDGSTDSTPEIMREYARRDGRVRAVLLPENQKRPAWLDLLRQDPGAAGEYLTILDADDWWEPDYLERLLALAEETGADITCTGMQMLWMESGKTGLRSLDRRLTVERGQFAELFSVYHRFIRPCCTKLLRKEIVAGAEYPDFQTFGTMYGWDTVMSMAMLRQAGRLCVDTSALYHYRIYPSSVTYRYDTHRFDSDVYCYSDALEFLSGFGPLSPRNEAYISVVFAYAVMDTLDAIDRAGLPPLARLGEYRRIVGHPVSQAVYSRSYPGVQTIGRSRERLVQAIDRCGRELAAQLGGETPGG